VPSTSKWKNMKDLIDQAKAKPGDVTYGSWSVGSPGHLGTAMLEGATSIQMTHVPYKELSQLYTAVGNGDVNWAFGTAASSGPMYRANKVKYIAVAAPHRVEGFADVPTVPEAGGPVGFEVKAWMALFSPRATPAPIIEKINKDLRKVLSEPEVRERFAIFGFEPYMAAPSQVTKEREANFQRYGEIVKNAKISID
jgi:tripartite-type tricarboxylate transporter receptor subunit TctC